MTRMTSSEAFVEQLVAEGVTDIFGIVGSAYMDALDIFEPAGIRFISVAHEQNAAHMADGYARSTNRHGVCVGQNGPGITNFVTAIAAAYWAHSPVVAITPETGSTTMGLGGFQETNQMPIFSDITKLQLHVSRPDRIAELTHRAFTIAMAERGPVQLNILRGVRRSDRCRAADRTRSRRRRELEPSGRDPGGGGVPGDHGGRRCDHVRGRGAGPRAGGVHAGAGRDELPAQRRLPRFPSADVRPARLPGLQDRHAHHSWYWEAGSAPSAHCSSMASTTGPRTPRWCRWMPTTASSGW